ncbi:MAG: TolC family protein [Verrucomicrobiota bacterium]|jgi:outer membrane protein
MKHHFLILTAGALSISPTPAAETNALPILTLAEAHGLALRNHPQVAAANYRTLAAEQVVRETRSGLFPAATLYGTAAGTAPHDTRILAGDLSSPHVFDKASGGVGLSQLITDFGRTLNLTAGSQYQAKAESQNAAATREQVLLGVDTGYFGALEAQAVLNVAHQTLDTRQLLLDQVSVLASNKLKSELDVSFAQVALEEGRLLVQQAQNGADTAMASLSTALGYHELHPFQLVERSLPPVVATNDVSGLIGTALRERPELLSLRDTRDASIHVARAQRDARLPTLAAVGGMGNAPIHDNGLPNSYIVGGVQLSVPLFEGGLYQARQREAELRAEADAELLRSEEDIVVRDVRIAWLNVNTAMEQLRTTEQLLDHASEAYQLADARYKAGSSSIVELSQAQLELTSAQIANTNARYDVLIQQANLNYQIGGLSEATRLSANLPQQSRKDN